MQDKEIRAIQELYSRILNKGFDLPKIVVIGPQSSGKSSVLEQVLQLDFLPRGINMVTRCPIVINLRKNPHENEEDEFVMFEDEEEKYFLGSIQKEIIKRMEEICGDSPVSRDPLVLYVYLRETLEITLVDLPGLTKIPVGDQPQDIERQIEEIVLEYSSGESTIILAIVNANVDIGNSEALKIAKRVDEKLERTLGVITKIDLMDEGTDCVGILRNQYNTLALGYIGVLNRSFQDVQNEVPFKEVRKKEEKFFSKRPYKEFGKKIGSKHLLEKLHGLFCEKVKKSIPLLRTEINNLILKKEEEERRIRLCSKSNILVDYFHALQEVVGQKSSRKSEIFLYKEENVLYAFKSAFDRFTCQFDFDDVVRAIRSSDSLIFHEEIIKDLVRKNSREILAEGERRVEEFVSTLIESVSAIRSKKALLPQVANQLNSEVIKKIEEQTGLLKRDLRRYMEIQGLYINTRYPGFNIPEIIGHDQEEEEKVPFNDIGFYSKVSFSLKNKIQVEEEAIRKISENYLEIIKRNFKDHALKSLYFYFIHFFKNEFLDFLLGREVEEGEMKELGKKKETLEKEIKELKESQKIINRGIKKGIER